MIKCEKCNFTITESMRYSLMKNLCPSCGSALFSSRDNDLIRNIESRLVSKSFAKNITEESIIDISMFIFGEIKYGIGKAIIDEAVSVKLSASDIPESESQVSSDRYNDDDGISTHADHTVFNEEQIRREVELELGDNIKALSSDGGVVHHKENEDLMDKAKRLKELRERQLAENPNIGRAISSARNIDDVSSATNKRRSGFKGVRRAE